LVFDRKSCVSSSGKSTFSSSQTPSNAIHWEALYWIPYKIGFAVSIYLLPGGEACVHSIFSRIHAPVQQSHVAHFLELKVFHFVVLFLRFSILRRAY
jgi:hypothetical protein